MPRIKDHAICIRHIDWSETSQVVALLTAEHGKVRGLAKGSKRTSPSSVARFSGGIELLTLGEVVATLRPSSDLANITEWDLQDSFFHLRKDLRSQRLAMYAANLADALIFDHDPHPSAFAALEEFLRAVTEQAQHAAALLRYQWCLLEEAGYRAELDRDVHTGKALKKQSSYAFDARAGGLTAEKVTNTDETSGGPWRVRGETVEVLRSAAAGDITGAAAAIERANRLLCVYVRAILDRQLPTMNIVLGARPA